MKIIKLFGWIDVIISIFGLLFVVAALLSGGILTKLLGISLFGNEMLGLSILALSLLISMIGGVYLIRLKKMGVYFFVAGEVLYLIISFSIIYLVVGGLITIYLFSKLKNLGN